MTIRKIAEELFSENIRAHTESNIPVGCLVPQNLEACFEKDHQRSGAKPTALSPTIRIKGQRFRAFSTLPERLPDNMTPIPTTILAYNMPDGNATPAFEDKIVDAEIDTSFGLIAVLEDVRTRIAVKVFVRLLEYGIEIKMQLTIRTLMREQITKGALVRVTKMSLTKLRCYDSEFDERIRKKRKPLSVQPEIFDARRIESKPLQ